MNVLPSYEWLGVWGLWRILKTKKISTPGKRGDENWYFSHSFFGLEAWFKDRFFGFKAWFKDYLWGFRHGLKIVFVVLGMV